MLPHFLCAGLYTSPTNFFFLVQSGHFPLESCVNRSLLFFFYLCNRPASSVIFKQFSCKNVGLLLSRFVKGGTDSSQRPLGKKTVGMGDSGGRQWHLCRYLDDWNEWTLSPNEDQVFSFWWFPHDNSCPPPPSIAEENSNDGTAGFNGKIQIFWNQLIGVHFNLSSGLKLRSFSSLTSEASP